MERSDVLAVPTASDIGESLVSLMLPFRLPAVFWKDTGGDNMDQINKLWLEDKEYLRT